MKCYNCQFRNKTYSDFSRAVNLEYDDEECDDCRREREHAQKYTNFHTNEQLQQIILSVIEEGEISIYDLKNKIRQQYDVDLFQHEVDLGISTVFVVEELIQKRKIQVSDNGEVVTNILRNPDYSRIFGEGEGIITFGDSSLITV